VFDDHFSTVPSVERETDPPDHRADLCLDNAINITTDDTTILTLHDDWLTEDEGLLKSRIIACNNAIQASMTSVIPLPNAKSTNISSKTSQRELATNTSPTNQRESVNEKSPTIQKEKNTDLSSELSPSQSLSSESSSSLSPNIFPKPTLDLTDSTSSPILCQSSRSNKGIFSTSRYAADLISIINLHLYHGKLCYNSELNTCLHTDDIEVCDPTAYISKASLKQQNEYNPTNHQAINGPHSKEYVAAMEEEVEH
jgi:hypothetical protein